MPFIRTTTNVPVTKKTADQIKTACGEVITLIRGKTENHLMVEVRGDSTLYFAGSDAPCAFAEIQLLGKASDSEYNNVTDALTKALSVLLAIPADRIYVRYEEVAHWGWNGSNF